MSEMGVGRIITPEEFRATYGRPERQIVVPNRRFFLRSAGLVVAGGLVACSGGYDGGGSYGTNPDPTGGGTGTGPDWSYLLSTLAVAAGNIAGVYFWGIPMGTLVSGLISSASSSETTVRIGHEANPMTQGKGTVSYNMPQGSDSGVGTLDNQGLSWLHKTNPHGDSISHVSVITASGDEVLPTDQGMTGRLPKNWLPGQDLYIAGLPMLNYKKLRFETISGQTGEIIL